MDADYDKTHHLNWTYRIQKISPLLQDLKLQVYWDTVDHLMDEGGLYELTYNTCGQTWLLSGIEVE